jgi:hypothetical protein
MKKEDYNPNDFDEWLREVETEYGGKYVAELRREWDSLGPKDCCDPLKILRKIKEADPEYQKNIQMLLQKRNQRIGDRCLEDNL